MSKLNTIKAWFNQPVITKKKTFPSYQHLQGNQTFNFNIPGIDPQKLRVINKNRKIFLITEKEIIGKITTFDQIDRDELNVKYRFGQVVITITPNMEKFKEYEAKIDLG